MNRFKYGITMLMLTVLATLVTTNLQAQELEAKVVINSQKIQGTSKEVFKTLETALTEFLNTRKWTNQQYSLQERITCSFNITVTSDGFTNGYVTTSDIRMECLNTEFIGTDEDISYCFHGETLEEGDVVKGNFYIISNHGEYYLLGEKLYSSVIP